ncbi:regulator of nonsense transcripts 3A-like isoform X2 [Pomacea canaliculata]|uniref:regulator of nonsense transcripts 3A-like isoform X2 n=1 Tax=Pomacea canaliculata TaxID=400727 RepID=UPI000D73873F|nr:regulator of nonsense transcripts 3A-like isoform X2 [Pomacea canaliculata]
MTQEKLEKIPRKDDKKVDGKRKDKDHPPTKVVVRRLPPSLTPENFLEQVAPLPTYDFFYFVRADLSLGQYAFTRAYINFQNPEDVFSFRDKFDGYVFLDSKGNEYPAVVEFATFQKVPKKKAKKGDAKKGTIEQDSDYKRFLETLQNPEPESSVSIDTYLEELEERERQQKASSGNRLTTPLLEFLKRRKEERKTAFLMREERRRREVERRRVKEDDRRPRKDPSDREGSGRDMRDRGQGRDKQWETDRQRDKVLEKGHDYKAGRDKDVGEKTEGFHHHHPVKLLKNTEREKEREAERGLPHEKDSFRAREERESKTSGRENLRFSKENRERERAEREKINRGDRGKPVNRAGTGNRGERSKPQQEDTYRRDDQYQQDERPHPGYRDRREKVREKERGMERLDRQKDGERDKNKKNDRDRDQRGPRSRLQEREGEWSRENREREGGQRRDKGQAGSSTAAKREAGKEGSRDENSGASSSKRDQDLPPRDRDRHRGERSVASKVGESMKQREDQGSPVLATTRKNREDKSQAHSKTRDPSTEGEGNKLDPEDRRRKRKERPERQIYVPPKALERRQKQEAAKETKRETGQGDSQSQSDKGEGQDLKRDAPVQQEASLAKQERERVQVRERLRNRGER